MTAAPPDPDLLANYVQTGSRAAFEQIVTQYIHLVHAAAVRQVRDTHLAEDITQSVFLLLWQRAESMQPHGSLAGWLLVATHHISRNAIKKEWRLKQREQKVAQMKLEQDPASAAQANSVLPQLDAAMAQLKTADRDAIVERFFNSRSLEEVGATLGVSQQAAAKRISRAMEKLRDILARRGITASQAMLGALLPTVAQSPGASPSLLSTVLTGRAAAGPTALARNAARPAHTLLKPFAAAIVLLALGGIVYLAVLLQSNNPTFVPTPQLAAPQAAALPAPQPQTPGERIAIILLVDAKTKIPLPGGQVELRINGNLGVPKPAGPDGRFVLNFPANFQYIEAVCRIPGRASMSLEFQNTTFKGDLATEYTVPMEKGTTIGGIVTDDMGNPLPGAKVRLSNFIEGNADAPRMWLSENLVTDAQGKWHFDNAPSKLDELYLEVTHHDYPQPQQGDQRQADKLRNGIFETVMRQDTGHQITGVVLDPDGKPVNKAKVVIAFDRYEQTKPTTMTDADGKFAVSTTNDEFDTYATVTAAGFAPEQAKIQSPLQHSDAKDDSKPLEIRLKPPVILEGDVVDSKGKPVRNATVEVEKWRGNRALKWSTKTNSAGQFSWKEAPADELQLNVRANRMADINGATVTPGGAPIHLTIYPPVKIVGNVVDADTKAPIQAFRIVYGNVWTGQNDVTWQTQDSRKLGNGKYEADIGMFSNGGKLRVEADGYLPAVSRMIQGDEGSIRIDFELKKGAGPSGIVLNPDGKPAADISVVCVPTEDAGFIQLNQEKVPDYDQATQTDKDGHFSFESTGKTTLLLASTDKGFALLKDDQLARDGQIHLQKWSRIEGDYRINADAAKFAKILAQATIPMGPGASPTVDINPVSTDANGHFVIEQVPPDCSVQVSQLVPIGGNSERYVRIGMFQTVAGQTTTFQVGGKGRPVLAKFSLPTDIPAPAEFSSQVAINLIPESSGTSELFRQLTFPEDFPDQTAEQQQQWVANQMKSRSAFAAAFAKMAQHVNNPNVDFVIQSDGTIRAEDVEPGTYRLQASLRPPIESKNQDLLGKATFSFTVPTTPACPTDEPLDLGVIQLQPPAVIKVGKPLPAMQLVTLDGQPIDQSAWAGKIIVLHLWDMHHRQLFSDCEQLADKYKGNSSVLIVNAGTGMLPGWMKHIATNDHLPGLLVMDKDSFDMNTQAVYMDHPWMMLDLPAAMVLDTHGNLITKVSEPNQLSAVLEKAVEK